MFTKEQLTLANNINGRITNLGDALANLYEEYYPYTQISRYDNWRCREEWKCHKIKWEFDASEPEYINLEITYWTKEDDASYLNHNEINIQIPVEDLNDESFDETGCLDECKHPLWRSEETRLRGIKDEHERLKRLEQERKFKDQQQFEERRERNELARLQAKYAK